MQSAAPILAMTLPSWLAVLAPFKSYLALFIASAICTALATPVYILVAEQLGWVDRPGGHKRHGRATPTMGGLVIFGTIFVGSTVSLWMDGPLKAVLAADARYVWTLLICTACMVALGIVDDRRPLRPKLKLLVQLVVAIAAVSLGYRIQAVTLPFVGSATIPALGIILSIVWIVGITNAINLTDGLDGLAAGIGFLAATVNALVALWLGNYYMTAMMALLAGALLGFLRWNFHPARVFLGDAGSLPLGMYLALCSMHSAQKAHTVVLILVPLFALGYPIFDTLLALARRMVRGQPVFASDRDHIHHRLVSRGSSHSRAALQIYLVSVLLCIACLAAMAANHLVLGLAIGGVLAVAFFSVRVLGYLEWGGWIMRWRGREETKVLHAAAQLARLKLQHIADVRALLPAMAPLLTEVRCRRALVIRGAAIDEWRDGVSLAPASAPVEDAALEMPLDDHSRIQFIFDAADTLDPERRQLLEELGRLAGTRMREL